MPVFFLALRRLRGPLITLICVYAVAVLGLTLIPGIDSNGNPWRMDFFHAFYFVSFMGSTIGFGEIPYPFTDTQRLWVLVCIYFSVVAWLYAIGRAITLAQEPAFRQAVTYGAFEHAVKRIGEPFYIICGYGDTGRLLVRGFSRHDTRTVVIDRDQEQINNLELTDHGFYVPGLRADVDHPDHLITAGLKHSRCSGVIAVTNSDHINLKVAISSKLLRPHLPVICRSEIQDVGINMESFGTDEIVNPFDIFADRFAMALHSPANFVIHQWLTSPENIPLSEPLFPPKGRWILCGYGRFGKAIQKILSLEGIEVTIIEVNPQRTHAPENTISGRGTEAVTLREGGVEQAVGIIAGTDDDANNLSIIMTARELNEKLFIVARQNRQENDALFEAAKLDLVMQRSDIIARTIITRITNPLLTDFLDRLPRDDEAWSNVLATRISGVCENTAHTWNVVVTKSRAPALAVALFSGEHITLNMILEDYEHMETGTSCLPLLLKRDHETTMLPPLSTKLEHGDQILFTGPRKVELRLAWVTGNANALRDVISSFNSQARPVEAAPSPR